MTAPAQTSATGSQVYTWEPSSSVLAARHGLRPADILRFDLNTSPFPAPDLATLLAGPFDPPLNEYPDSLYQELADAAAAYVGVDPSMVVVGAGADEVLDIIAKTFLPPADGPSCPSPRTPCMACSRPSGRPPWMSSRVGPPTRVSGST